MKTSSPLCVLAALLLFAATDVAAHGCGDIHAQLCLDTMRNNTAKDSTYWFGTSYAVNCPNGSNGTWECRNKDTAHMSIITRMRNSNDTNTMMIAKILNVTYFMPEEVEYEACDNMYMTERVNLTLDPAHTAHAPSLVLNQMPSVTWTEDPGVTYTLIIWDAGDLMLHGVFINIQGSNMATAQTAMSYRGPVNPISRTQPHLIAIFNQTKTIDVDFAVSQVKAHIENQGGSLAGLMSSLNLTGPVGISLLTVVADQYSVEQTRQMNLLNYCPLYVTPAFNKLSLSYNVSQINLTVFIDVTFRPPPIYLNGCCDMPWPIEAELLKPNPIGNQSLPPVYTRVQPEVVLEHMSLDDTYFFGKLYAFLMLDVTNELNQAASPNVRVHWQIVNIQDGTLESGLETLPYVRPDPMTPNMDNRTYLFLLLRQGARVNASDLTSFTAANCTGTFVNRCRFNLTKFITTLNMAIEGASWFSGVEDEDYRVLMANEGRMMTMTTLCSGVACGNDTTTQMSAVPTTVTVTMTEKTCGTGHAAATRYSVFVLAAVVVLLACFM